MGVAHVRCEKFSSLRNLITDCGNIMPSTSPAKKREVLCCVLIVGEQCLHVDPQFSLGLDCIRQVQRVLHADSLRDRIVELLDRTDAYLIEHFLLNVGKRVGDIGVCAHLFSLENTQEK